MSKIALVTLDDMPPLALGEFQLSDDFETLFAGVGDVAEAGTGGSGGGGSIKPTVPSGTSPSQIKAGVFSRLNVYAYSITTEIQNANVGCKFTRVNTTHSYNISVTPNTVFIKLTEV